MGRFSGLYHSTYLIFSCPCRGACDCFLSTAFEVTTRSANRGDGLSPQRPIILFNAISPTDGAGTPIALRPRPTIMIRCAGQLPHSRNLVFAQVVPLPARYLSQVFIASKPACVIK